jgi:cyclopropane fatty-acyl-phospholipid synthase-like methyltransferase
MLDEVLKTGKPVTGERDHEAFIRGMHNLSVIRVKEVIRAINLNGVRRALDLGGGPGTYAIELAKKGIDVVLFDVPETRQIAESIIKKAGSTKGSIEFIGGDFLVDDIGRGYDLIFVSQVLHMLSERRCTDLLRKCYNALNKKGRVVIQEFFLRENRTSPVQSALFSINMLINTEKGKAYTPSELIRCCRKAGFKRVTKKVVLDNLLLTAIRK